MTEDHPEQRRDGDAAPAPDLPPAANEPAAHLPPEASPPPGAARADLRASDQDRKRVTKRLRAAEKSGELTREEYEQRVDAAQRARTYGALGELTFDLAGDDLASGKELVPGGGTDLTPGARRRRQVPVTLRVWLFVTIIVNVVWLLSVIAGGELIYYWPMWPMGGMLIPFLAQVIFGDAEDEDKDDEKDN